MRTAARPLAASAAAHVPLTLALVLAALGVSLGAGAMAQATPPLTAGARVRITSQPGGRGSDRRANPTVGALLRLTADTIHVDVDSGAPVSVLALPRDRVSRVEISRGPETRIRAALRAARVGAILGIVLGGAAGYVLSEPPKQPCFPCVDERPFKAMEGAAAGGLIGGVITGWIGSSRPRERWAAVRLSPDTRVGLLGARAVGLAAAF